jgi:PAS domain S-box-containing protein
MDAEARERLAALTLFRAALEAAPDGMVVFDTAGTVRFANEAAHELLGYAPGELRGARLEQLIPPALRATHALAHARFLAAPTRRSMGVAADVVALRKDGREIPVDVSLSPAEGAERLIIAAMRDVTERRMVEGRVRATQRMEAIGRLAGGIAHDFNNTLAVILMNASLVRDQLGPDDPVRGDVDDILAATRRASALTQQLLLFSRHQVIAPRKLDLGALVLNTDRMLRRVLGEDIELVSVAAPQLWAIEADPGQIEQILLNLALNSRHAMPKGGKLAIETANVPLDEEYARGHPDAVAGDYVLLAVSDTGIGMSQEVRAHLFEPFFTTKPVGEGTGLGLATVYGIVRKAGGHIGVYSEPGRGTTFKIYFPRASGGADALPQQRALLKPRGGTETILVVEDEAAVRAVIVRTLRGAGYSAVEAANGDEALLKLQAIGGHADLVFTDIVMPGMGGRELAAKIHETAPAMRILFASGYTEHAVVQHGDLDAGLNFLPKPFSPEVLLQRVRAALDA